jgi:hypothetical protein
VRPAEVTREPDVDRVLRVLARVHSRCLEAVELARAQDTAQAAQSEAPARAGNLAAGAVEVREDDSYGAPLST